MVTNPDGTLETTSYDKGTITFIDANGHKKVEVKDLYGRLIRVEEYTGTSGAYSLYATTTYEYNTMGNLLKVTDAQGNQTEMEYDTLGRKKKMTDPDMGVWTYTYDPNGNLKTQTDAKPRTVSLTYDRLNRVTLKDNPSDTDMTYAYDEAFSTNAKGRLTTMTDESGTTRYYYDKLGRTVETRKTVDTTEYITKTTFDTLGRTKSVTYPDGETVNYTYDSGGSILKVEDAVSGLKYAEYNNYTALGQIGDITYGNGVVTSYTYKSDSYRLSTIVTGAGLLGLSYEYDNVGNITDLVETVAAHSQYSQTFTYDDLDRLETAQSTAYGSLSYAYDTIGNITSKRGVSYTYGGPRPHAVTGTSGNTPVKDRSLAYNDDNKPSSIYYRADA